MTRPHRKAGSLYEGGVYFNAHFSHHDPQKLLPPPELIWNSTEDCLFMCVSLAAATVYAVGQVNLRIAADTKIGPFTYHEIWLWSPDCGWPAVVGNAVFCNGGMKSTPIPPKSVSRFHAVPGAR